MKKKPKTKTQSPYKAQDKRLAATPPPVVPAHVRDLIIAEYRLELAKDRAAKATSAVRMLESETAFLREQLTLDF